MSLLLTAVLTITAPAEAEALTADYVPRFPWCNTRECDEHTRMIHQRRRARARERAAHRRARHRARLRRYTAPYRGWLRSTRRCESGGRYRIATGNGFYGAYQFTLSSWRAVGGRGYPHHARPLEQDYRAVRLLHLQGRGAWPVCG